MATILLATGSKTLDLPKRGEILSRLPLGVPTNQEDLMGKLSNCRAEFYFDPENSITFNVLYSRHEDIFLVDGKNFLDAASVRFLMRKRNPETNYDTIGCRP